MGFFDKLKKAVSGIKDNTKHGAHKMSDEDFDEIDDIDDDLDDIEDDMDDMDDTDKMDESINRIMEQTQKSINDYISKAQAGINKALENAEKNPEAVAAAFAAGESLVGLAKEKFSSFAKSFDNSVDNDDNNYSYSNNDNDGEDDNYSYSNNDDDDDDDDNSYNSSGKSRSCSRSNKSSSSGSSSKKSSSSQKSYGINSNVRAAEAKLNQAKQHLESEKRAKEQAKKNGNYKNSPKGGYEGHVGNAYDRGVYYAQKQVKQAQEELRRAKREGK